MLKFYVFPSLIIIQEVNIKTRTYFPIQKPTSLSLNQQPGPISVEGNQWESMYVSREFQRCLKGVSRVLQGSLREFQVNFRAVLRKFQGRFKVYFKGVLWVFQGSFKKTYKMFTKKFHVAWHSSQPPEQKEGLFKIL